MVSTSSNAVDTFGNLESLYGFISTSKKRIAFFEKSQKKHYPNQNVRRLKRVETTRWMSYSSALNNVLLTYNAVIETLEYIVSKESRIDFKVGAKASGLIDFLLSHRFILTALYFKKIFNLIDPLTRMLQAIDIDLLSAINIIQNVHTSLKQIRCENIFEEIFTESNCFMSDRADDLNSLNWS